MSDSRPEHPELQHRLASARSRDERRRIFADFMTAHPQGLAQEIDDSIDWFLDSAAKFQHQPHDLPAEQWEFLRFHFKFCGCLLIDTKHARPTATSNAALAHDAWARLQALILHHVAPAMTLAMALKDPAYVAHLARSYGAELQGDSVKRLGTDSSLATAIFIDLMKNEEVAFPRFLATHAASLADFFAAMQAAARKKAANLQL